MRNSSQLFLVGDFTAKKVDTSGRGRGRWWRL